MKWLNFNSLRKRYAVLTLILATIMFTFSWYAQKQVNLIQKNVEENIQSRNKLLQQERKIINTITQARELLFEFQIEPELFSDDTFVSTTISQAIKHIKKISQHPWIMKSSQPTISELIITLKEFDQVSKKLILTRLSPQKLFPSLKVANSTMQPLYAKVIQNLQLAIKDLDDNRTEKNELEYRLLLEIRFYWISMISNFRMYLLNQLYAFQKEHRVIQLHLISELQDTIKEKLNTLKKLNEKNKLTFTTTIALEIIHPSVISWIKGFKQVKEINNSQGWRTDTLIYQNELGPKFEKIDALMHTLALEIEEFSKNDLKTLTKVSQTQVDSIWISTLIGLLILLLGFLSLIKLILNPIESVTHALKDETKGIETSIQPKVSIEETKNLITAFKEMRQQIHSRQEELEHLALHDSLTGLANRELLSDRLKQAIHNAKQERGSFAVLIMDLDRFKDVNDTLGHSVGDKLLQQVASRLVHLLRDVDLIVRLGGDEFSVLLNATKSMDAEIISKKILDVFQDVFVIDDTPLYLGISIGISIYPQHGTTPQLLQQRADVAMYVAKRNKTGYEIYDPKYDEYSIGRLSLISDLREAIDENQLFMEYQPVIDINTSKVISAEALLRWNHPTRGKIYPDDIIPIAEQTGLINPMTYYIIDAAAKYNKRLESKGIDIKIAINLSVYNLQETNFVEKITKIFDDNEMPASSFIMEVTESVMMTNPQQSIDVLNQLDNLGIEIAVDDYGTGYSSLAYLKRLPISKLKIDKSFIMDMMEDDNDAMIVRSTIDLAHNLGMEVIAEGIEKKDALDLLSILGCKLGQGYYISRPISENKFENWVIQQHKNS